MSHKHLLAGIAVAAFTPISHANFITGYLSDGAILHPLPNGVAPSLSAPEPFGAIEGISGRHRILNFRWNSGGWIAVSSQASADGTYAVYGKKWRSSQPFQNIGYSPVAYSALSVSGGNIFGLTEQGRIDKLSPESFLVLSSYDFSDYMASGWGGLDSGHNNNEFFVGNHISDSLFKVNISDMTLQYIANIPHSNHDIAIDSGVGGFRVASVDDSNHIRTMMLNPIVGLRAVADIGEWRGGSIGMGFAPAPSSGILIIAGLLIANQRRR